MLRSYGKTAALFLSPGSLDTHLSPCSSSMYLAGVPAWGGLIVSGFQSQMHVREFTHTVISGQSGRAELKIVA